MKLFTLNGVDIKAYGKLKTAKNGFLLTLAKLRLTIWPSRFSWQNNNFYVQNTFLARLYRPCTKIT